MDLKVFLTVFITIFIAEIGDKTQLATMLFATDRDVNKWLVFAAASLALTVAAAIGVLAGNLVSGYIGARTLNLLAGTVFIIIGIWILFTA